MKIGITIGDKNGIGPEVILKALKDPRILSGITPVIYGCESVLNHYRKTLDLEKVSFELVSSADKARQKKISVVNVLKNESPINEGVEEES